MKNRNKHFLSIVLIILFLLLVTAGVSVAFFSYAKEGSKESAVKLGSITFKYTENENLGNGISITDAFPMSDEEGKKLDGEGNVFDFKVESNLSRSDLEYEVVAEPVEDSTLPLDAIKFYLTDITSGIEEEIAFSIDDDGSVKTLDRYNDTEIKNTTGKTVYQETILKNTKGYLKQFRARMWIDEEIDWANEKYMNTKGSIRINVYANSDRSMASGETTNPEDISIERVTANNKYLFSGVVNEEYQYSVTVPNDVETINIDVIPKNTEATVEIIQISRSYGLKVGENFFRAKVTSASQAKSQEYILRVVRETSGSTDLESLGVTGYTLIPNYNNSENLYEVEVPYEVTSVEVTATKKEEVQTISGTGIKKLEVGINEQEIIVTAENGVTRTIKITIIRKQSDDASINNVGVKGYSLAYLEENIYTVTVPYNVESIEIENVSTTGAKVEGIGIKENLVFGNNDYEVEVTSQSGTVKNKYIIRIIKEQDTVNTLASLSLTGCILSPEFSSDITSYTCIVENSVTSTIISANATSGVATVTGTGEKSLIVGVNTIDVEVTAQNGIKQTYTVSVTRLPNSDASLKTLGVEGQIIIPAFDKDTLVYTLSVPYSVDSITITGTATQSTSNVDGLGSKVLALGENKFNIVVIAEDKTTTRTYELTITRLEDTDTSLKSISVEGHTIVKVDDNHYTLTVDNSVTSVIVNAEATSSVAVVTGTGSKTLNIGSNVAKVTVTAQSGAVSVYEIDITRLASSDATLKSLTVSNGTLSPTFASGTTSYTLSVPYSVTSLTVNATVNNSEAKAVVSGNTGFEVGVAKAVTIKVTAGDGTTKTYTITVTRQKDTTSTLKSLSLSDCTLSPTFASGTTSYSCTVENSVTSTTVSATATSSVATVTGTGSKSLSVGTNTVTVKVTAQSGGTKSYTVTVTRKASSDATLKSLTVSSGTLSPTFASGTTSYTLSVPYSVTSLTVTPTVNNSEAKAVVSGNTGFQVGVAKNVTIKVTAGDGTTKTYTITVTRQKDTTNTLKSLGVTGYSLNPAFNTNTTSYTLTVEASSVEITAQATSSVATVSGTGNKTLNWGTNTVSVIVTAQDGTAKTYKITITNQEPTAPTITGGSDSWVSTAPTIKVSKAGTALSDVKHYEYVKIPALEIGDSVTLSDGSKWHVLESSESGVDTVVLLSDYNLNVDGTYNTGCGIDINGNDACGERIVFDNDNTNTYNESDSNNIGYFIKNTYAPKVTAVLPGTTNITLPTASQLAAAEGKTPKDWLYFDNDWLATTTYWTKTPFGNNLYYIHGPYKAMITSSANTGVHARPVITTLKTNIVEINGSSTTGTTSGNLTVSDEGIRNIWYRTVSNNGFKSDWTGPQVTKLDTTAPVMSNLYNPTNGNWTSETFDVTFDVNENGSGVNRCEYSYDGVNFSTGTWSNLGNGKFSATFLAQRNNTAYIRCVDNSERISNVLTTTIKIDKTTPTITMNANLPSSITLGTYENYAFIGSYTVNNSLSGGSASCKSNLDGVVTNLGDLKTKGTHTITCTVTTGAGKTASVSKNINVTYTAYVAKNLVTNGSFENGISEWGNYDSEYIWPLSWDANGNFLKYGSKVFRVELLKDCQVFLRANYPDVNNLAGHKIYAKVSVLKESGNVDPGLYFISAATSDYWPSTATNTSTWYNDGISSSSIQTWHYLSLYTTPQYNYFIIMLAQRNNSASAGGIFHFDGLTVIDLTQTFGAGNEPDKSWCDQNINYFDGESIIYK